MDNVYVGGPITGEPDDIAWRVYASEQFKRHDIVTLTPLREKDPAKIGNDGLTYEGELARCAFAYRDRDDVQSAQVMLCNVNHINPNRPPWGTPWEMGWGNAWGKHIVLCSKVPQIREHVFSRAFAHYITSDLDSAIKAVLQFYEGRLA